MSRKNLATALVVIFLVLPGCFVGEGDVSFEGTAISGPVAGDFTLTDQDGNEVSLRDYEGDVVVIMFIFTSCPDVCPVTTQNLGEVANELGSDMDGVTFLSISVDPEYDTPERLNAFTEKHGVDWPHLTGSLEESEKVWVNFGIVVDKAYIDAHVGLDSNYSEERNHVMVLFPDNSSYSLATIHSELSENATGWDLTNLTFSSSNVTFNHTTDESDGPIIQSINSTTPPDNHSWNLFVWNTSNAVWEESMVDVDNLSVTNMTNIAWAINGSDPSSIPSPQHEDDSQTDGEECNGHGYVMSSGAGAHCMCDEGYAWAEGDQMSCVPEDGGEEGEDANYSVGHTTVLYILDKGQHKRVIWTGDSWVADKIAHDIRILLDEDGF